MSSSYTDNRVQMSTTKKAGYVFVNKPYGSTKLPRTIRENLGKETA